MRTTWIGIIALAAISGGACGASPAVTVIHVGLDDKKEQVRGDPIKLKHGSYEAFAGARAGYHVVRSTSDWKKAWAASAETPPVPATIDSSTEMLFVVVADKTAITRMTVKRAVETAEMVHVYVRQTKLGDGCVRKPEEGPAVDVVHTARIDKPVRFVVDEDHGDSCGDSPRAAVACRIGSAPMWTAKLTAQPGDNVECELDTEATGRFALVDSALTMTGMPAGSAAKLSYTKGAVRGSFAADVYGAYSVGGETTDDSGRRGTALATIDVPPPRTRDVLVQLIWTNVVTRDDPDSFPRFVLRVAEDGPQGQRCTPDMPVPGLCEGKIQGAYAHLKIPASDRRLALSGLYLDERTETGPGACVHVWLDGVRTAESCDRRHRDAEEVWNLGVLDTTTGKVDPNASFAPPDAGAPPPAPAAPPKKKPAAKSAKPAK